MNNNYLFVVMHDREKSFFLFTLALSFSTTTLRITKIGITTLAKLMLSITKLSKMILSSKILSITTLGIMIFSM